MHKARNHPLCTASTSAVGTHKRAQSRPRLPHAQHPSRVRDPEKQRERRPHVSSRGARKLVPPRIPFTREPLLRATIPNAVCWPFIFPSLFLKKVNRVIQFATVRIVAPPGSLPTPASSVSQRFALLPAGFAAHACKLRLATVRIVARRVRCPRLRHVFLCFVSSWGRRLTPPYPMLPQAACTPTPPAPPSSASLSSGSPLLHIRPGMLDTTTSPQALLPLRRREA
jgi:hypothetical protein